jgi:hypothetical protein
MSRTSIRVMVAACRWTYDARILAALNRTDTSQPLGDT